MSDFDAGLRWKLSLINVCAVQRFLENEVSLRFIKIQVERHMLTVQYDIRSFIHN